MNMNKGKIIIFSVVGFVVLIIILGVLNILPIFKKSNNGDPNYPTTKIELTMWGVTNQQGAFSDAIKAYTGLHTNVKIAYQEFSSWDTYKNKLINAFAQGNGPDIFMVNSSWAYSDGGIMLRAYPQIISVNTVKSIYPDVVSEDFIKDEQILALPLYMDALVMAYNKNMFNARAITFPPTTWDNFSDDVIKLRSIDSIGNIIQSGSAIGTANNVSNSSDILSTIIMQLGSKINAENSDGKDTDVRLNTMALNAFKFYTQFSNPISPHYTWNNSQKNSRSAFADGTVGMIIDYRDGIKSIQAKNPFLKIGIAPMPQVNQYDPKSFADYAGLSVSRHLKVANSYVAWDFIKIMTTNATVNKMYLDKVGRLPALKSEIQKLIGGEDDPYARAFLYAESWKRIDWVKIKEVFANSINDFLIGRINADQAIRGIQEDINAIQ